MENSNDFEAELAEALAQKQEWAKSECLPKLLDNYRLLFTCVKNVNDFLVKKSLITPDPYKMDVKVTELSVPESDSFTENETATKIGSRLSEYQLMLDYLSTYFKFSLETVTIAKVRKLQEFSSVFLWDSLTVNNAKQNTRALATLISNGKTNTPALTLSMINDSLNKAAGCQTEITDGLRQMATYLREEFKFKIRKELIKSPKFNKDAMSSAESEAEEIKRLYPEIISKKNIPNELISEITHEDLGPDQEKYRAETLARLEVKTETIQKKKQTISTKDILMNAVFALGGLAPTIIQLQGKLNENFEFFFAKPKNLKTAIGNFLKKLLGLRDKEQIIDVPVKDPKTNALSHQKLKVAEFTQNLDAKIRLYNGIAAKGTEYTKINSAKEDVILPFLNKQISDVQSVYTLVDALDDYLKQYPDPIKKSKFRGMKIELAALRNSIIAINKKRGEYASIKEEQEQMQRLGLNKND